jgi:hypothetical protein
MARPAKPRPLGEYHDSLARLYKGVTGDGKFGDEDRKRLLVILSEALGIVQRTMAATCDDSSEPSARPVRDSRSRR